MGAFRIVSNSLGKLSHVMDCPHPDLPPQAGEGVPKRSVSQLNGGVKRIPPLVQSWLRPRSSFSGDPMPTVRS